MKYFRIYTVTIALVFLAVVSCDKEVQSTQNLKTLQPTNIDANAGTWRPVLLASNNQINVPAPASVTSDAYKAELQDIKNIQAALTKAQRKSIEYWSAGGVLRWNEILRGLVARFNLPPAPNNLGAYPAPDAENPFGDPNFPFANPPYAARAYSYVAAAQYDALKAAWYWKYQHNRPAPYNVDSGIEALMPRTDLPAYPSEDAVMSAVSAEVLKLLFPAAVEEITKKAAEQRSAAFWSGKASRTDLDAGIALGKAIATVFTDRARTDGMGTAGGNRTQWQLLADNAKSRGEIPWISLETPPRPPMLPLFGLRSLGATNNLGVRAWSMTNADIVRERPLPPPPTASQEVAKEVEEVMWYSKNLTRDRLAIVHKWADGAGTYTPPGHWDEIASHYIEAANFSEVRAARAFALINMALHDAAVGCWETKFYYFNPRPSQMDPNIKTGTGVPNFPAYTSGHSTFSAAAATVLSYLFPNDAQYFNDQATEASLSRLYGAIHYRSDCEKGLDHGTRIAGYTVNFARTDGAN
jgi:PAP2 superfamily